MPRPRIRRCSECGEKLVNEDGSPKISLAKTCSVPCKSRRQRRLAAAAKKNPRNALPEELEAFHSNPQGVDVMREVMKEELRPIAREAITTDVMQALEGLVGLTGQAVAVLADQLGSDQPEVAQKAAALVLRYTAGNASIAPAPQTAEQAPMQVVLNMGAPAPAELPAGASVELKECMECHEHKPEGEFVAGSDRCTVCHDRITAQVRERFGG